MKVFKLSQR
jgi:hypothetical protein